jgi:hypothetical protein
MSCRIYFIMEDEIIEVLESAEDISEFVKKLIGISFDSMKKTSHFFYSLDEKGTEIEILKENFILHEKIKMINKRKHRNNNITYDFYYELDDGTYLLYCIALEEIPILLNAYHVRRNFNQFKKSLIKAYRRNLTG